MQDALPRLDTLPEALLLEICNCLDVFSLVAFSEVNRSLRNLANTRVSFWLHSLARSGLFLPLPTHRALHSFTATELNVAAHRAVLSERNITSVDGPKLVSWKQITWPYEPSPKVEADAQSCSWEAPESAIHMHLSHPNSEWMFTVSANNILRILHLRSGKLALAYDYDQYGLEHREVAMRIAWAVEFREENDANLVMNCHVWDGKWKPAIRLWNIRFIPEECLATMKLAGTRIMPQVASHLDIAGGYIVAVEAGIRQDDPGQVRLIRTSDMKEMTLPLVYPSVRIAAFQEYFVTVGSLPEDKVVAQIIGYPDDSLTSLEQETSEDIRSSRLPMHSYELDFRGPVLDKYSVPFACQICHFYTGTRHSPVKIWLRPGRQGIWSVYTLDLDLDELRSSAIRFHTRRACDGESLLKYHTTEEQYRILLEITLRHWSAPVATGRRFIWWRPKDLRPVADTGVEEEEADAMDFKLFLSVIDDLAPVSEMESQALDSIFKLDYAVAYEPDSAAAKQLQAARQMEIPNGLRLGLDRIYMFVMEEWSGSILVQMYSGDLWVLRYGKA